MSLLEGSKTEAERSENTSNLGAFLGIKGRNSAIQEIRGLQSFPSVQFVDEETGEITNFVDKGNGLKPLRSAQEYRADRFAMKAVVNRLFPHSETSKCCRAKIPEKKVTILKDKVHKKAFYSGLRKCSSVWLCPICAAKIAERRSVFLQSCIDLAKVKGWRVYLLTATTPHGIGDDLKTVLDKLIKAWNSINRNRAGKAVKARLQIEGTIRAVEVTHGDNNGFHPHFHVLLFTRKNASPEVFEHFYRPLWQDCCVKAGLPRPSDEHGLKVTSPEMAAIYVAKGLWGLPQEMTKGPQKTAMSEKGKTPWGLLMEVLKTSSKRFESLFFIYAQAFKGKKQLTPSSGLYEKLGVFDLTDEELTAIEEESALSLAQLTDNQWRAVMVARCESSLLDLAERDPSQIQTFLKLLEINYFKQLKGKKTYE